MSESSSQPRQFEASVRALLELEARSPEAHVEKLRDPVRLSALEATELMDTVPEQAFDRFTSLAVRWVHAPIALLTLVDDQRQFFKSARGLPEPWASRRETPLTHSFCQYAVTSRQPFVVFDAREHALLRENQAIRELDAIAYAGIPLITSDEQVLGALCVIDSAPRFWSQEDIDVLCDLAAAVAIEIELRLKLRAVKAAQAESERNRLLLRSVLDCMDDAVVVTDKSRQIVLMNHAAGRLLSPELLMAAARGESAGMFLGDGVTPYAPEHSPTLSALAGHSVRDVELLIRDRDGNERSQRVNASPIRDSAGAIQAAVSVARDSTRFRRARTSLARSEALFRTVVQHLPNGAVLLFDRELRYLMAEGEALLASAGFSSQALVGRTLAEIVAPERLEAISARYRAALAGEPQHFETPRGARFFATTIVPVPDDHGTVTAGMVLTYDITRHKEVEEALRQRTEEVIALAIRDELTGLYNRRGFMELARHQLMLAERSRRPLLLFFADIDGMKRINDEFGHEQGDQALIEAAQVLRESLRASDLIARLGGDEFVALLPDADRSQLEPSRARVQAELAARNARGERRYQLSLSIGGTEYDASQPEPVESLLARADALMYEQKRTR